MTMPRLGRALVVGIAVLLSGFSAAVQAHPVEFIFEDNNDGTFTFSAMTIVHGSLVPGTGFLINGYTVAYDNEYAITDAAWDAKRAAADGATPGGTWSFDAFSAQLVLDVTLNLATLSGFGLSAGNPFTIDTYSPDARWASGNSGTMIFTQSAVAEPATLGLLALGLAGFGFAVRRRQQGKIV